VHPAIVGTVLAGIVVLSGGLAAVGIGTTYTAGDGTAYTAGDGTAYAAGGGQASTAGGGQASTAGGGQDSTARGGAASPGGTASSSGGGAASTDRCEYWTIDEGVSAVVVTSGVNCGTKSFKIDAPSYHGAVFSYLDGETPYNAFLTQISEFVNGPASAPAPFGGSAPSVKGLKMIGSADNAFTNDVPVSVYKGPGDVNDTAAEALNALIHNTFEPQI
jgi:hypothetical protein